MSTNSNATLLLVCMLFIGCVRSDPNPSFEEHSTVTIPASAKLIHSGVQDAGFDASYGFVFDVSDNELQKRLIDEWQLQPTSESDSGFFKFAKHPWWPTDEGFLKMDENFGRTDDANEEYWQVWHDRSNGRLYVEHGRW